MRWDADFRRTFAADPTAVVTDDLVPFVTIGGYLASVQYQTTTPPESRYKMTPQFIPGRSLWYHEREHDKHWRTVTRVGDAHEAELLRELFTLRGADPALVDRDRNLAKEQAASLLPEAFLGEWGGFAHPIYGTVADAANDARIKAYFASPAAAAVRAFFLAMPSWVPTGSVFPTSPVVAKPEQVDLRGELPRASWSNGTASKTSITVHWNGGPVPDDVSDLDVIFGDAYYHLSKDWSDAAGVQPGDGIMYHRLYGRDGTVYLTRAEDDILWHCGSALGNARSAAWQVMVGTGQRVTAAQLASLQRDLAATPLPRNGHRDWSPTDCPGDELYALLHEEEDMFTDEDRRKLDRVYAHQEAYEPLVWIGRLQKWLAKAIRSLWPHADLSGPDVESGEAFQ